MSSRTTHNSGCAEDRKRATGRKGRLLKYVVVILIKEVTATSLEKGLMACKDYVSARSVSWAPPLP